MEILTRRTGGISYFSARKGFASDNVVNFEVVLASGKVVNANARSNMDLWRALRGGSNNFGVVTRFDLRAFKQGNFWGGSILYPDSAAPSMLKAFADLNRDKNFDEYAALMQSHAYAPGMGFLAVANIQYTKAVENPKTFQAYPKLQPQYSNTMRISNQTDFTDEFIVSQPSGRR
jgi:FAD/FMN-containing dehydrogenase